MTMNTRVAPLSGHLHTPIILGATTLQHLRCHLLQLPILPQVELLTRHLLEGPIHHLDRILNNLLGTDPLQATRHPEERHLPDLGHQEERHLDMGYRQMELSL